MTNCKTVLHIEDDEDARELLEYILEDQGFKVISCANSEEGLKLAEQNSFSLIVLDHRLAEVSGLEICRRIRMYDKLTPIIFYSAAAFSKDGEAGLAAGANDYLIKPTDFDRIAKTINRLVS